MRRIFMIGDSTMHYNKFNSFPQIGWGQALNLYTKRDVLIFDFALNGRSTKSFIDEGVFEEVYKMLQKGDYLICQFGHNDEKEDVARHTDKDSTYLENLAFYAKKAKEKGANIVFATSISRRNFINGVCVDSHKGYPQAMKKWADENGYVCIDLNQITLDLYNELGEEETKKYHMIFGKGIYPNYMDGKNDNSHLRIDGAMMISRLFVEALYKTTSPLKDYFYDVNNPEKVDQSMLID